MTRMGHSVVALALMCGCSSQNVRSQSTCLPYEPRKVEVTGKLRLETKEGPPGYGEQATDQRIEVPMLDLAEAISICADTAAAVNTEGFSGLRQLQVIFSVGDSAHRSLIGRSVVVYGTLSAAQSGHHFTKVVLSADRVAPAE